MLYKTQFQASNMPKRGWAQKLGQNKDTQKQQWEQQNNKQHQHIGNKNYCSLAVQ
jgi:hypothetical protein